MVIALIIYLGYQVHASGRRLIPISVLAVIAGVLFEDKRLSGKWKPFLWIALSSFVFSLPAFLPAKSETNYRFLMNPPLIHRLLKLPRIHHMLGISGRKVVRTAKIFFRTEKQIIGFRRF